MTNSIQNANILIESLTRRTYWEPTKRAFSKKLAGIQAKQNLTERKALRAISDYLTEILQNSEKEVNLIQKKRVRAGKIRDLSQSRKSIAGHNYQALVAYFLARNVLAKNLPSIEIMLKPKKHPLIKEYATIGVGSENLKPDADLIIYQNKKPSPLIIISCKTSLRERAGQTYRWKLLLDIAQTYENHKDILQDTPIARYKLKYKKEKAIIVGLVTADLYKEISDPQQRGNLSFFDFAYVTRPKSDYDSKSNIPYSESTVTQLQQIFNLLNRHFN